MKGEVVYLYAFHVANEIENAKVQQVLASKPFSFEIRTDRRLPKDVPLYKPLAIEPPFVLTSKTGQPVRLLVRIYEVGVVSIVMRVAVAVENLTSLLPFHQPTLENGQTFDQVARSLCAEVCKSLEGVMKQPAPPTDPEAYTAFCLGDLDNFKDVNQWLAQERRAVAGLLAETEPSLLSESQVEEVLRIQQSFEINDVVVIDWDAALVVDLTGYSDDVLFVLELANLQLEEFKVMDQKLDRELNHAYEELQRWRYGFFGISPTILKALRLFRVDLTKLNDEVTHISKFFGDWYLARVYLGARERFHLDHWRSSVEERLGQLDSLYNVVQSEMSSKKLFWLEVIMVIFFAIDLFAILFLKK